MGNFVLDEYSNKYYNAVVASTCLSIYDCWHFHYSTRKCTRQQKRVKGGIFVNCSKFTDFGLCVKTKLLQMGMSQKQLEEAVSEQTGLFVDNGYMYKILTGQRNAPQVVDSIRKILDIAEEM